jgi:hypothetical protein
LEQAEKTIATRRRFCRLAARLFAALYRQLGKNQHDFALNVPRNDQDIK